jgi:RecB family exonuclease
MQTTVCITREENSLMDRRTPKRLSPSSIDLWRQCPRRFAFHEGLIEADISRLAQRQQTYEQVLGLAVHAALERLMKVTPERRTPEVIQQTIEWTAANAARKASLDARTLAHLRHEADELVLKYLVADGAGAMPVAVERNFELRLTDGTAIRTRVDRLDRRGDADDEVAVTYEIVDYKTGRVQIDSRGLALETAPIVQLHAVSRATSVPVERVTWLYLRSGESVTWWPEEEDVEAATERLLKTLSTMRADCNYEPSPGAHCAYCPFKTICPANEKTADASTLGAHASGVVLPRRIGEAA